MVSVISVLVYRWRSDTFLESSVSSCITNLSSVLRYQSSIACYHLDKSAAVVPEENCQKMFNTIRHIDNIKYQHSKVYVWQGDLEWERR